MSAAAGAAYPRKMSKKKKAPKGRSLVAAVKATTIGDLGGYVMEAAGAIRNILNTECKRFDAVIARSANLTTGRVNLLSLVPLGDDFNQRDGRSIRTVGIEVRILNELDPTVGLKDLVRTVLFVDMENAGAAPAVTDLLTTAHPLSPFNVNNVQRFIVLMDNLSAVETYTTEYKPLVEKIKLDDHVRFRGAAGTVADCAEGHVFLVTVSLSGTAAQSYQTIYSRLSFVDN